MEVAPWPHFLSDSLHCTCSLTADGLSWCPARPSSLHPSQSKDHKTIQLFSLLFSSFRPTHCHFPFLWGLWCDPGRGGTDGFLLPSPCSGTGRCPSLTAFGEPGHIASPSRSPLAGGTLIPPCGWCPSPTPQASAAWSEGVPASQTVGRPEGPLLAGHRPSLSHSLDLPGASRQGGGSADPQTLLPGAETEAREPRAVALTCCLGLTGL